MTKLYPIYNVRRIEVNILCTRVYPTCFPSILLFCCITPVILCEVKYVGIIPDSKISITPVIGKVTYERVKPSKHNFKELTDKRVDLVNFR